MRKTTVLFVVMFSLSFILVGCGESDDDKLLSSVNNNNVESSVSDESIESKNDEDKQIDSLSKKEIEITEKEARDFIKEYYGILGKGFRVAYNMTSFVNETSFETFVGWYKNIEKVDIIDVKKITNSQYEIIVDIIEPTHITRYNTIKSIVIMSDEKKEKISNEGFYTSGFLLENEKTNSKINVPRGKVENDTFDNSINANEVLSLSKDKTFDKVVNVAMKEEDVIFEYYHCKFNDTLFIPGLSSCEYFVPSLVSTVKSIKQGYSSFKQLESPCALLPSTLECNYKVIDGGILILADRGHDTDKFFHLARIFIDDKNMLRIQEIKFNIFDLIEGVSGKTYKVNKQWELLMDIKNGSIPMYDALKKTIENGPTDLILKAFE